MARRRFDIENAEPSESARAFGSVQENLHSRNTEQIGVSAPMAALSSSANSGNAFEFPLSQAAGSVEGSRPPVPIQGAAAIAERLNTSEASGIVREAAFSGSGSVPSGVSESFTSYTQPVSLRPPPLLQEAYAHNTATSISSVESGVPGIREGLERVETTLQEERTRREAEAQRADERQAEDRRALQTELAAVKAMLNESAARSRTSGVGIGVDVATSLCALEAKVESATAAIEALRSSLSVLTVERAEAEATPKNVSPSDQQVIELRDELRAIREQMGALSNTFESTMVRLEVAIHAMNEPEQHKAANEKPAEQLRTLRTELGTEPVCQEVISLKRAIKSQYTSISTTKSKD